MACALHIDFLSTEQPMKTTNTTSTAYAVLVRYEQEERSVAESAVYLLFILCAVFSIWQVARQPITLPGRYSNAARDDRTGGRGSASGRLIRRKAFTFTRTGVATGRHRVRG